MGTKGAKMTFESSESAEELLQHLSRLGDIRLKKMFGGYGIFNKDVMFGLVTGEGGVFFKADDSNIHLFEQAGSPKHIRMPYYRVPDEIFADETALIDWAKTSITVSRKAKSVQR